jgi:tetratricopeptide (TPR) repeat protein
LYFEEAEKGYRKAAELSDFIVDYWIGWADVLYVLSEYETAVQKLLQISNFHPDEAEISYRLAVLYLTLSDFEKAIYHLTVGLNSNYDKRTLIQNLFPDQWQNPIMQNTIKKFESR